jgi:hypothetical protein
MTTADESYRYARECLQWASEAQTDEQRDNFFAMARAWTQAALQMAAPSARAQPVANVTRDSA